MSSLLCIRMHLHTAYMTGRTRLLLQLLQLGML